MHVTHHIMWVTPAANSLLPAASASYKVADTDAGFAPRCSQHGNHGITYTQAAMCMPIMLLAAFLQQA